MYDPRNPNGPPPMNGNPYSPGPSIAEMLLMEMRAFRSDHMDMREDLGALKEGMRRSLNNDMEIFTVLRTHGDRMSAAEQSHRHLHDAHHMLAEAVRAGPALQTPATHESGASGRLSAFLEALPSVKALIGYWVWFLVALGVAISPEKAKMLLELLGAVN